MSSYIQTYFVRTVTKNFKNHPIWSHWCWCRLLFDPLVHLLASIPKYGFISFTVLRMPARKGVKTLESSTLKCIGDLFKSTCRNLASTLTVKKVTTWIIKDVFSFESVTRFGQSLWSLWHFFWGLTYFVYGKILNLLREFLN